MCFNTPYAASLHEGLRYDQATGGMVPVKEWGQTRVKRGKEAAEGTGAHFESAKLDQAHGVRYFRVIAAAVKKAKRG